MLEQTFSHIPGIGTTAEQSLWEQGCHSWQALLDHLDTYRVGQAETQNVKEHLERSIASLAELDPRYFTFTLGQKEAWRAFPEFRSRCVYLDIETDGGSGGNSVTTVGMYDGREFVALIKDQNLDEFPERIAEYGMIVTFFGASFDLPMLQKRFRGLRFDQIHIDLCPTLRRVGYRGGLKKIERQVGISRGDDTDGLNGMDAVRLWRRFTLLRDDEALRTLIAYNREDVVNLERLTELAYSKLRREVYEPFARFAKP